MKPQDVIKELEAIQRDYAPNPPEPLQRLIDKLKAAPKTVHRDEKGRMAKDEE